VTDTLERRPEVLSELRVPIVLAPLAGGPATVELAVAVADAGGLGFLAAGYTSPDTVAEQVAAFRELTSAPLAVNVFTPPAARATPSSYAQYVDDVAAEGERIGVKAGSPAFDDDGFPAKIDLLVQARPEVVSFVFGCPPAAVIERLRSRGITVLVTVTTPSEALEAAAAGADGLVAQGLEAGGHRGSASNDDQPAYGLLSLLALVGARVDLPLVAAGGIATGAGLAAVLSAGAIAAQIGTAFLLCPEANTATVHRAAVASDAPTAVTRAFTGKPARGIVNRFMVDYGDRAPAAYPELHHVTSPLRAAARKSGDPDLVNLWAGQAHELARPEPAAEVVRRLMTEARGAVHVAGQRLSRRDQS
jgi:nitronate monooxygenase